ncbi:MAG: asparaginase [Gemmatimonadota bacterium]|jgi:L-asparaginase II|nr:asparaginase [Gemmatimonadota bacterium]MDQ3604690.1 asparaginase [Gemmatimonadota bacterium]
MESCVEVLRGALVESRHRIHAAVVDAEGRLRASTGDPELITFFRSAAKPFQALPLVQDGVVERLGLTQEELALCCGSHSAEARHLLVVESMMNKAGVSGEALACGPHQPFSASTRRELAEAGLEPGRLHNNCSGKHVGMMALARVRGWNPAGYQRLEHPVQGRMLAEVSQWVDLPAEAMAIAPDGCGIVCFGLPIRRMALAYARLAAAARRGEDAPAAVVRAMVTYPEMVAGEDRLCTDLMRRTEGRIFAKVGAEGVYCVGVPGAELGIALKVEDGASRAIPPAVLAILRQLDLISEDDLGALHRHAYPELLNTCSETVGQLRPNIRLYTPDLEVSSGG